MVFLEGQHLRTGDPIYETSAKFWTRIFALNFAIGVATGIVMEFQFGTNWATYSRFVGDVFGSALAAEGIFAFFLESGFLALLVFGWDRVSPACTSLPRSWFRSAGSSPRSGSWLRTAGSRRRRVITRAGAAQRRAADDRRISRAAGRDRGLLGARIRNPSTIHRLVHVWIGAFILGSFFVMSISAWYLLKNRHLEFAKRSFSGALLLATLSALAALVSGDFQAKSVYRYQPAKLAAFEGNYRTGPADMSILGVPDDRSETIRYNISIPGGLSFLLHNDFDESVIGLDRFRPAGPSSGAAVIRHLSPHDRPRNVVHRPHLVAACSTSGAVCSAPGGSCGSSCRR